MDRICEHYELSYRKRCISIIIFIKNSLISYVRNYISYFSQEIKVGGLP